MRIGSAKNGWVLKSVARSPVIRFTASKPEPIFDERQKRWVKLPPREAVKPTMYTTIVGVQFQRGGIIIKDRGK